MTSCPPSTCAQRHQPSPGRRRRSRSWGRARSRSFFRAVLGPAIAERTKESRRASCAARRRRARLYRRGHHAGSDPQTAVARAGDAAQQRSSPWKNTTNISVTSGARPGLQRTLTLRPVRAFRLYPVRNLGRSFGLHGKRGQGPRGGVEPGIASWKHRQTGHDGSNLRDDPRPQSYRDGCRLAASRKYSMEARSLARPRTKLFEVERAGVAQG